jgi:hypothetical protein
LFLLCACAKVDDMHDATMQMNKTTSELAATTADTKKLMGEIYDSGRQGASLDLRNKLYDLVTHSPKIEEKATNAGLYFLAFEFELWSNLGVDQRGGQRDVLMKDAADEFFCHLLSITHWDSVDPFAGKNPLAFGETENERAAFNAFALTLERSNRKQTALAADNNVDNVSMRSMVETALLAGKDIREGKSRLRDYPSYVEIILSHEENAIRLLKARYQMLGLAVLTQLTPIAKNNWNGFLYKIWGSRWQIDFNKLNQGETRLATFRLQEAQRAKSILAQLGIQEELDPAIKKIYSHAQVVALRDSSEKSAAREDTATEQEEFLAAMGAYLQN